MPDDLLFCQLSIDYNALYLCMCQALPQSGNTLYAESAEYSNCPIEQVLVWGPRAIHWEWWQDIFLDQRFAIAAHVQNLVTSNLVLFCYIAFQSWTHFTSTSEALWKLHLCNYFALMQALTATACMFGVAINCTGGVVCNFYTLFSTSSTDLSVTSLWSQFPLASHQLHYARWLSVPSAFHWV